MTYNSTHVISWRLYSHRPSTEQVKVNPNILTIIDIIGKSDGISIKEMMEVIGIKHRPSFLYNYLQPAINGGFVQMLYPNTPKHSRQKYHLTPQGTTLLNTLQAKKI